jgi:hypothetical protein
VSSRVSASQRKATRSTARGERRNEEEPSPQPSTGKIVCDPSAVIRCGTRAVRVAYTGHVHRLGAVMNGITATISRRLRERDRRVFFRGRD